MARRLMNASPASKVVWLEIESEQDVESHYPLGDDRHVAYWYPDCEVELRVEFVTQSTTDAPYTVSTRHTSGPYNEYPNQTFEEVVAHIKAAYQSITPATPCASTS